MKKLFRQLLSFVLGVFLIYSCQPQAGKKNIRAFYFPLDELKDGLVYEYESAGPLPLAPVYWHYRSLFLPEGIFLTGTQYGEMPDLGLAPTQFVREEMISNGMLLADLYFYRTDSSGKQQQVPVEKIVDTAFPFEVSEDGGVFLYKIKWQSPEDSLNTVTLIKNRRYLRDTSIQFQGQTHQAILMEVKELAEQDHLEDGHFEQQFNGVEIYARNIGLFYYKKIISDEFLMEYRLKDRYPMERLVRSEGARSE